MEERASWTTAEVRRLLDKMLPSDAELRAFLLDALGHDEYRRIEGIQNRTQLVTEVLARYESADVVALLQSLRPVEFSRHHQLNQPNQKDQTLQILPSASYVSAASQRAIPFVSLIRREAIWAGLLSSTVTLIIVVTILSLRRPTETPVPQIVIVQSSLEAVLHDPEMSPDLPIDSPEEFVAKVQKAGPGNVVYRVARDEDLLRLVLALMKENLQLRQIARMKYQRSQIKDWQRDSRPEAQFLARLTEQIEEMLQVEESTAIDLGVPSDGGLLRVDQVLLPSPIHEQYEPPSKLKQQPVLVQSADAATLSLAQSEYARGNYRRAIELAKSATKGGMLRAWRIIGSSACSLRNLKLASDAYRRLDKVGRQYLVYICQRHGIQNTGSQFRLSN